MKTSSSLSSSPLRSLARDECPMLQVQMETELRTRSDPNATIAKQLAA